MLRERLAADGGFEFEPAPQASIETICLAHDREYVQHFVNGTLDPQAMRRIGFPWSEGLVRRTLASAGGTLAATSDAFATGIGATLSGGTHHAFRSGGSGFCVFNDVAIAIHSMRARGDESLFEKGDRLLCPQTQFVDRATHGRRGQSCLSPFSNRHDERRVAVVDLDVHQGDGTAHFFENDARVLTLSLHGARNFPFRKQRSTIDVELPDETGDEEYLRALDRALPRVWEFDPGVVFYLSGVDALESDVLGRLSLTYAGLQARDERVIGGARKRLIPLVITLGGGYSNPIELTVAAHANTFRVAAKFAFVP